MNNCSFYSAKFASLISRNIHENLEVAKYYSDTSGVTDAIVTDAFLYYSYDPASSGEVSRERMYELYRQNLALVLAYVDILLLNIDAEQAVVTADHGEGLGHRDVWSHPYGYP